MYSIICIEFFLNVFLVFGIFFDEILLRRKFTCFIFLQGLFDSLSLFVTFIISATNAVEVGLLYFYVIVQLYQTLLSISVWMLMIRSCIQFRIAIAKPKQSSQQLTKASALLKSVKIYGSVGLFVCLLNFVFPTGYSTLLLQSYFIGYPCFFDKIQWNYFAIVCSLVILDLPGVTMAILTILTAIKLFRSREKSTDLQSNQSLSATLNRRRKSSYVLFTLVVVFVIVCLPLQIYYIYCTYNDIVFAESTLGTVLNNINYLYFAFNPCIVILLCNDIRQSCKRLIKNIGGLYSWIMK